MEWCTTKVAIITEVPGKFCELSVGFKGLQKHEKKFVRRNEKSLDFISQSIEDFDLHSDNAAFEMVDYVACGVHRGDVLGLHEAELVSGRLL